MGAGEATLSYLPKPLQTCMTLCLHLFVGGSGVLLRILLGRCSGFKFVYGDSARSTVGRSISFIDLPSLIGNKARSGV